MTSNASSSGVRSRSCWLRLTNCRVLTEQQTLRLEDSNERITAYIASGLTSLNDDQLAIVELVSSFLSECCGEADVLVHQPILHTHPKDHADLAAHDVHATDFARVIGSDLVIAIGDFASWGAGKELVWAERLRIPVLMLVRPKNGISRLVTGTTADFEIHEWRFPGDLRRPGKRHTYHLSRRTQFEAHRRLRADRDLLWGSTLSRLLTAYHALSQTEQQAVGMTAQLTTGRIEELLAAPRAFAEASLDEAIALSGALGLASQAILPGEHAEHLPPRALAGLQSAAALEGWDGARTVGLLRQAEVELAKGGSRRLVFNAAADWISFASR